MSEQDIQNKLDKLFKTQANTVQDQRKLSSDFAVMNSMLVSRETKRLQKKYGKNDIRVASLKQKKAEIHRNIRESIAMKPVERTVKVDSVLKTDAVVEGAIHDEHGVGVKNLNVYLVDEAGKKISDIKTVKTDESGGYSIKVPKKYTATTEKKVGFKVVVESNAKEKIVEDNESISLAVGERMNSKMTINRAHLLKNRLNKKG